MGDSSESNPAAEMGERRRLAKDLYKEVMEMHVRACFGFGIRLVPAHDSLSPPPPVLNRRKI